MARARSFVVLGSFVVSGCASHRASTPESDPAALARVRAEQRVVGSETTWVTHGPGYELVGRTKADLVAVQPRLDAHADVLHRLFPHDTLAPIVVTVRRAVAVGKPFVGPAPLPNSTRGEVVEVVLPNPLPAVRAWLSAHATALTKKGAPSTQSDGEAEDTRVPAWAHAMIPLLGADSLLDRFTLALAAHPDEIYPLSNYFTMERPSTPVIAAGERGAGNRGGGAGTGGGMGGRGGMGGGRGGMGRAGGGSAGRGGGGGREGGAQNGASTLRGGALYDAESLVFGKFLVTRESYGLVGALVDGVILGKTVDETLKARNTIDVDHMDVEWHRWLLDRAATLSK